MTASKLDDFVINLYMWRFQICMLFAVFSGIFLLLSLFSIQILIGFAIFASSIFGLIYFKWKTLRQKGLISYVSPKLRQVLLNRSFYDIYRDQVYYPYFTKILGIFVKGAVSKPHPQQLDKIIDELPDNVKNAIYTKGILHLAPQKLQKIITQKQLSYVQQLQTLPQQIPKIQKMLVPKSYGQINKKWDRQQQYEKEQIKTHQRTISKQVLMKLNQKITWAHIVPLASIVTYAVMKTKGKKLGKIFLYNGSVIGIITLMVLIVIKYKKPNNIFKKIQALK